MAGKPGKDSLFEGLVSKAMRELGVDYEEAKIIAAKQRREIAVKNLDHSEKTYEKCRETRRRKRTMQERTKALLEFELPDSDTEIRNELIELGFPDDDVTQIDSVNLAILKNAKKGDVESARYLRDTSGNAPTSNVAVGNLDDKPFTQLDLSTLSTEQLLRMIEDLD